MALLKQMICGSLLALVLMALAAPFAQAQDSGRDERELRRDNRRGLLLPQRQSRRPNEIRPEQRLSPEERRQLRRDIKDAGREIYLERR